MRSKVILKWKNSSIFLSNLFEVILGHNPFTDFACFIFMAVFKQKQLQGSSYFEELRRARDIFFTGSIFASWMISSSFTTGKKGLCFYSFPRRVYVQIQQFMMTEVLQGVG